MNGFWPRPGVNILAGDCPRLIAKFWPGPGRAEVVILAGAPVEHWYQQLNIKVFLNHAVYVQIKSLVTSENLEKLSAK